MYLLAFEEESQKGGRQQVEQYGIERVFTTTVICETRSELTELLV